MRVELSDGHHAVLRGPETVRNRERRVAARATDSVHGAASKDQIYVDAMIALLLESWDVELPRPSVERDAKGSDLFEQFDSFDELTPSDYDALRDAALGIYAEAREITIEPDIDPASPTSP